MVIKRTDISFGPLRGARALEISAGRRTGLRLERQENRNRQHAHDRYDDGEGHTHLHKIAETILPGSHHQRLTGEEIGVMKAADAASATVIANGLTGPASR
jgi:hypothetical protein